MWNTLMLCGVALMFANSVQAATLNKCIDAVGQVTYSNLPCLNARKSLAVEIDPAPTPDPVKPPVVKPVQAKAAPAKAMPSDPVSSPQVTTYISGKPVKPASASQCDNLSNKLGAILDKMDEAHRKGYTQAQMNKWDQEIKALETKKQQSGCF